MKKKFDIFDLSESHTYYLGAILGVIILACLVLLSLFNSSGNFEYGGISLAPPGATPLGVCANITSSGYYYLNSSVGAFSGEDCFIINASNVILEGNSQHIIFGNLFPGSTAVRVEGDNVTLLNLNITDFDIGINVLDSDNFNISYSGIVNSVTGAININDSSNNAYVGNNILAYNPIGISVLYNYQGNVIENNKIYDFTGKPVTLGIVLLGTDGNNVSNNFISGFTYGEFVDSSNNNYFKNNYVEYSILNSLYLSNSQVGKNVFENESLIGSADGIYVQYTPVSTVFENIRVEQSYLNDVKILDSPNITFIDTNLGAYQFLGQGVKAHFIDSGNTEVRFLNNLVASGYNLSSDVGLGFNYAFVNSSISGLDKSAEIKFEGLSGFYNPEVQKDGSSCSSNVCNIINSYNNGEILFSVTGWSNYSIGEGPFLYNLNIDEPDPDEFYDSNDFPVTFKVSLNSNGSSWFTFDEGQFNYTMNSTNKLDFTYKFSNLSDGFYNMTAYANFTLNNTIISKNVSFEVNNSYFSGTSGSILGGTSGSSSGNQVNLFNNTPRINSGNTGNSGSLNNNSGTTNIVPTSNSENGSFDLKNVSYWLVVSILIVAILLLVFIIVKHLRKRFEEEETGSSVLRNTSGLR